MKRILSALIVLAIIGAGILLWWKQGTQAVNSGDKSTKLFVIDPGMGIREIANKLHEQGLIKDPIVFFLLVRKEGLDSKIQAGDFRLSPSQNARDLAETLTHGNLDIWVTIPEGKRAEEIADIFQKQLPSFTNSWREVLDKNEGYLFPDTYLIPKDATVDQVVTIMRANFDKRIAEAGIDQKDPKFFDALIIASIIEKEAKYASDMPIVSSVIHNRLDNDMKLQVDPSVDYAIGYDPQTKTWWRAQLTFDDLKINSPYNTYLFTGLPPGPISNPGVAAIKAALNPANTDYMFYVSDKEGHIHGALNGTQHEENIKKFGI